MNQTAGRFDFKEQMRSTERVACDKPVLRRGHHRQGLIRANSPPGIGRDYGPLTPDPGGGTMRVRSGSAQRTSVLTSSPIEMRDLPTTLQD